MGFDKSKTFRTADTEKIILKAEKISTREVFDLIAIDTGPNAAFLYYMKDGKQVAGLLSNYVLIKKGASYGI